MGMKERKKERERKKEKNSFAVLFALFLRVSESLSHPLTLWVSETVTLPSLSLTTFHLRFARVTQPCLSWALGAPVARLCTLGHWLFSLLTTCCRQTVLLVPVHHCTFFSLSQNIKCIKEQWNSATNKDSTTADRVEGWASAREKFDPLCMLLWVSVCVYEHKAQRKGINTKLLRVETGRHAWWNFF